MDINEGLISHATPFRVDYQIYLLEAQILNKFIVFLQQSK